MPDFLLAVFTSKNFYNFNVFKCIQKPIKTFLYFIPLVTHRQSLGIFSGRGNLWKIILCPSPCERNITHFAEDWSWSLALGDLPASAHTVNCTLTEEKEKRIVAFLRIIFLYATTWRVTSHLAGISVLEFISLWMCCRLGPQAQVPVPLKVLWA